MALYAGLADKPAPTTTGPTLRSSVRWPLLIARPCLERKLAQQAHSAPRFPDNPLHLPAEQTHLVLEPGWFKQEVWSPCNSVSGLSRPRSPGLPCRWCPRQEG